MLFALESQRTEILNSARQSLAQGKADEALPQIQRAARLRDGADVARLTAISALLRRDFAAAFSEYRRAQAQTSG